MELIVFLAIAYPLVMLMRLIARMVLDWREHRPDMGFWEYMKYIWWN